VQEVVSSNLTSPTIKFCLWNDRISIVNGRSAGFAWRGLKTGHTSCRGLLWPVAIAGLIFLASSRSYVPSPGLTKIDDKFAHFAVYGLLGTLVCRLGRGWRAAFYAFLVVSAFGASDEWHQSFVPGRFTDFGDWLADTLGAAVAVALYAGWTWYRQLLERPVWRSREQIEKSAPIANVAEP
jgi:VanZ family protein